MAHVSKVANEILELAGRRGEALTPMQLLKLTYISHGYMLGYYDRPLFNSRIEAWKFGPVIPWLYHQTKQFRSNPINATVSEPFGTPSLRQDEQSLIQSVYEAYGHLSGPQLSTLTHQPSTPWSTVWNNNSADDRISDELISEHFKQRIDAST